MPLWKKIIIQITVVISVLIFFIINAVKAKAIALTSTALLAILAICGTLIVGTTYVATQDDFDNMSATDVFEKTNQYIYDVNKQIADGVEDVVTSEKISDAAEKVSDFVNRQVVGGFGTKAAFNAAVKIGDWVRDNSDNVAQVAAPGSYDMKGYGASLYYYEVHSYGSGWKKVWYYCDYVVIKNNGEVYGYHNKGNSTLLSRLYSWDPNNITTDVFTNHNEWFRISEVEDYAVYGDVRHEDGTSADDYITPIGNTVSADVGIVDIDGTTVPVAADGTVTVGDNTYPINSDGTVTIGDTTYTPMYDFTQYDDTAVLDLLQKILKEIEIVEDVSAKEVIDAVDINIPTEIVNSELSTLEMSPGIANVFPFCLPFDFYNGIKLLSQPPVAPRFEIPFEIPKFGLFPGYSTVIVCDFSEYENYFDVVRWGNYIIFVFGLIFVTFKIVKGI